MVTLYNGDRQMIVAPDEVKEFESQGWSKKQGGSALKVEKVAEKVAEEPVDEEVTVPSKKKRGTRNKFV